MIAREVNDQYIKVAKLLVELVWHAHDEEEAHIVLIETVTTKHTGDVIVNGTVPVERQLDSMH